MTIDELKQEAALRAVAHIQSGMRVGLGTGSTAYHAINAIGHKLQAGELSDIHAVATSEASAQQAKELGIPLINLDGALDIAIDGMDELDPQLNVVKGLGGALTREKIVAAHAKRFILIGDERKHVKQLGDKVALPVEVIPLAQHVVKKALEDLGLTPTLRLNNQESGAPYLTDNSNIIFDCGFAGKDAQQLAQDIRSIVGVVEHGLFLGMAHLAYVASAKGVEEYQR